MAKANKVKAKLEKKKEPLFSLCLFSPEEQVDMRNTMVASLVGMDKVTGFIIIAENNENGILEDTINMSNISTVTALGYAEKLNLFMKNKLINDVGVTKDTLKKRKKK